jgi:hypothetical protein
MDWVAQSPDFANPGYESVVERSEPTALMMALANGPTPSLPGNYRSLEGARVVASFCARAEGEDL